MNTEPYDKDDVVDLIPPQCGVCTRSPSPIRVRRSDYEKWQAGTHIQHAFPEMTPDQREMLMTGTHSDCWDTLWNEEHEQEYNDD